MRRSTYPSGRSVNKEAALVGNTGLHRMESRKGEDDHEGWEVQRGDAEWMKEHIVPPVRNICILLFLCVGV